MTEAGHGPGPGGAAAFLPRSVEEITPDWLTAVLRAKGALPATGRVLSAKARQFGAEEGFTWGTLFRIALRYDRPAPAAPATLVAKLSPQDPAIRQQMKPLNAREARFYQRLEASDGLPLARCFHAASDPDSGASILLLQDLTSARRVPFVAGCDAGDALRVVDAMAEVHARWWNSPVLPDVSGSDLRQDLPFRRLWADYPARLRQILPDAVLPQDFLRLGDAVAEREADLFARLMDMLPLTCLHRDLHVDNVLFVAGVAGETAILLDWQLCGRGRGACDLGYFMISSLDPLLRRGVEQAVLTRYHRRLVAGGVRGYSLSDCREDYLLSVVFKLFVTVAATVLLDSASPGKARWRAADLSRLLAFCADHNVPGRLCLAS